MSSFEVKVCKLIIEPHTNADTLELAKINDYVSCVRKGEFPNGSYGVYIPEQALVPEWLLKKINLWDNERNRGQLSGPNGQKVKIIRLRQVYSQGLVYPVSTASKGKLLLALENGTAMVNEGDDVASLLGITKWEPTIPVAFKAGNRINNKLSKYCIKFDIENLKANPNIFEEGEEVVATSKLHGTFVANGMTPEGYVVHSKGLGAKGISFKVDKTFTETVLDHIKQSVNSLLRLVNLRPVFKYSRELCDNVYVQNFNSLLRPVFEQMKKDDFEWFDKDGDERPVKDLCIYFLGEIYGRGVQDLTYGTDKPEFACFDVYIGQPGSGYYCDYDDKKAICDTYNIPMVPLVYRGPFSKEKIKEITKGKELVSGKGLHVTEGVVILPVEERHHPRFGRVMLKSVSEEYLLRKAKNGEELTEFN